MSKKFILPVLMLAAAFGLHIINTPEAQQNPTCPTRPAGDSTNACASTAFTQNPSNFSWLGIGLKIAGGLVNATSPNVCNVAIDPPTPATVVTTWPNVGLPTSSDAAFRYCLATGKDVYIPATNPPHPANYDVAYGHPVGCYYITGGATGGGGSGLEVNAKAGQRIFGEGPYRSMLCTTYSGSAGAWTGLVNTGLFVCNTPTEPGPVFENFGIRFDQYPTRVAGGTVNTSNIVVYQPAIDCSDGSAGNTIAPTRTSARSQFKNLRISGAYNGIDLRGNNGGDVIVDLQMSAFNAGLLIDGMLDTVRIDRYHFWPFDLQDGSPSQTTLFAYPAGYPTLGGLGSTAAQIGRCDGCLFSELLNIGSLGLYVYENTTNFTTSQRGAPWVQVTNSGFDSFNGVRQVGGKVMVSNSYFSLGYFGVLQDVQAILQQTAAANTDETVLVGTNLHFSGNANNASPVMMTSCASTTYPACNISLDNISWRPSYAGVPFASAAAANDNSRLSISNSVFTTTVNNAPIFSSSAPSSGFTYVNFMNNLINYTTGTTVGTAMFTVADKVVATMMGNRVPPVGGGAGTFWSVTNDQYHLLVGNVAPGWTCTLPAVTNATYANNKC